MSYTITLIRDEEIPYLPDKNTHPPPHIFGKCKKCGNCCEYYNCPALDKVTRLCKIYKNRPVVCRQWPLTDDQIAMTNCKGYHVEDEQ